jgi:hypothetical protein
LKVLVAAAIGAFAFGGLGLAAADVLPPPVQDVAHTALDPLGVHVPPGHDRFNDPVQCPGGPYRNHGAYVRTHKGDPNAGKSPCGKPVKSLTGSDAKTGKDDQDAGGRPEGAGPPPWAHGNKHKDKNNKNKDKNEKNDDKTEHEEPASNGSHAKEPDDDSNAPARPNTTTPAASTTTTSAPPASTTSTSAP